ncbi:MAG: CDP-alcohol phosphatidyltransferase family protein [Deltaproteobacteria bacterium]|nr:CDP-alcohol phosphatidyltransferase family protein [Deltaproteobacteria bacterium]
MLSWKIGHSLDPYIRKGAKWLIRKPINPNLLTFGGFGLTVIAGVLLAIGQWFVGGWVILAGGLFDLLDGAMARNQDAATPFGAFLDSVIDRYSDFLLFLGITIYYLRNHAPGTTLLTIIALGGAMMVPYIRAKAEALIAKCNVGLMERAERILVLAAGALLNWMVPALWIIAVLSHLTVAHRIYYTSKELRKHRRRTGGK